MGVSWYFVTNYFTNKYYVSFKTCFSCIKTDRNIWTTQFLLKNTLKLIIALIKAET